MSALELIELIRKGQDPRAAQEKLYGLVQKTLLRRIASKIPPLLKPRLDPEDVLNEAFLRVMVSLDRFQANDERSFYAWVYTIAKNLLSDQSSRRSAAAFRFARDSKEKGPRESKIVAPGRSPETQIQRQDLIESTLRHLTEKEAEVIRLHGLKGKSFEEIASSWNKTPAAVQRFFSRAWKHFRKIANQGLDS